MTDIQFDEESQYQRPTLTDQKPYFVRLVQSTGLVSTDEQANYVLLSIAVLAVILAFSIPFFVGGGPASPPPASQIIWVAGPNAVPGNK